MGTFFTRRKVASGFFWAAVSCVCAVAVPAWSQAYPNKPIRMVSPYAPGGGNDVVARALALGLGQKLGQPVIVENKAGANGLIGADYVAKQPPDGYTIILVPTQHVYNAAIYEKLPYDPIKDFTPISLIGAAPLLVVASKDAPFKTVTQLADYAKKQPPNSITFSTAGAGSAGHLAGALLAQTMGISFQHVPYRGAAPAGQALFTGEVMLSISPPSVLLPFVQDGKVNAIGLTSSKRSQLVPNVATIAEQGVAGFDAGLWYGVLGPANMPRDVVAKLNQAVLSVVADKTIKDLLIKAGVDVSPSTPEEFGEVLVRDTKRWAPIVKAVGLKPQ